jgi:hypothetical protein
VWQFDAMSSSASTSLHATPSGFDGTRRLPPAPSDVPTLFRWAQRAVDDVAAVDVEMVNRFARHSGGSKVSGI